VLTRHFGIDIHDRHRAYGDALATARVLLRLLDEASGRGIEDFATLEWYLKRRRKQKRFDPEQYSLELPGYRKRTRGR
jgi:DNA polymerase III alpha subunit (gram-positive type)